MQRRTTSEAVRARSSALVLIASICSGAMRSTNNSSGGRSLSCLMCEVYHIVV